MSAVVELSNERLVRDVETLRRKEREVLSEILSYLAEIDSRRLYLELGYSSLFTFCTKRLGYSEGATQRRIRAVRVIQKHGEVQASIENGELSLSSVSAVASVLTPENKDQVLTELRGASRKEAEVVAARFSTRKRPPRERVRALAVTKEPPGSLFEAGKDRTEERVSYSFSVPQKTHGKCERAKELLSSKFPRGVRMEQLLEVLLDDFLKHREPQRAVKRRAVSAGKNHSRHVPAAVRREVWRRDGGCCSFVGTDGVRCGSRWDLELDHIQPFALGGKHTAENLRLVCRAHNKHLAERVFGAEKIKQFSDKNLLQSLRR